MTRLACRSVCRRRPGSGQPAGGPGRSADRLRGRSAPAARRGSPGSASGHRWREATRAAAGAVRPWPPPPRTGRTGWPAGPGGSRCRASRVPREYVPPELTRPTRPQGGSRLGTGRAGGNDVRGGGRREHRPDTDVQPVRRVALQDGGDAERIAAVRLERRRRAQGRQWRSRDVEQGQLHERPLAGSNQPQTTLLAVSMASVTTPSSSDAVSNETTESEPADRPGLRRMRGRPEASRPGLVRIAERVDHDAGVDADLVARGVAEPTEDVAPVRRVVAAGGSSGQRARRERPAPVTTLRRSRP